MKKAGGSFRIARQRQACLCCPGSRSEQEAILQTQFIEDRQVHEERRGAESKDQLPLSCEYFLPSNPTTDYLLLPTPPGV